LSELNEKPQAASPIAPALKPEGSGKSGGKGLLIVSVAVLVISLGALGGAAAFAMGVFGAPAQKSNAALDLIGARAEVTRSIEELSFLSELSQQFAQSSNSIADQDGAARLQFAIANAVYDRSGAEATAPILALATEAYAGAKRENAAAIGDIWLQWKKTTVDARAAPSDAQLAGWTSSKPIAAQLVQFDADNPVFVRAEWASLQRITDLVTRGGDLPAAQTEAQAAVAAAERLVALRPDHAPYARDLWTSLISRGDIMLRADNAAGAKADYERALSLVQTSDASDRAQADMHATLIKLGGASVKMSDWPAARVSFQSALDKATAAGADPAAQRNAIQAQVKLGEVERDAGDLAASRVWFEKALVAQRPLVEAEPQNASLVRDFARNYAVYAGVLDAAKDTAALTPALNEALKYRAATVAIEPTNIGFHRELVAAYEKLALTTKAAPDWQKASRAADALAALPGVNDSDQKMIRRIKQKAGG
jgi:tetratricopeptide (TPR) repeat protein